MTKVFLNTFISNLNVESYGKVCLSLVFFNLNQSTIKTIISIKNIKQWKNICSGKPNKYKIRLVYVGIFLNNKTFEMN